MNKTDGLLRQPDFLKLWSGQAISQLGSSITLAGLPLTAIFVLHATPLQMGLLGGAGAAAVLVFGLLAGAWVDRRRRRPILIAADLSRAAVLGSIPLAALFGRLTLPHLYAVAAASGILTVLFDSSYQAYLPALISRENLLEGNSKLALSGSLAEVVGPGMTGLLIQWITAPGAILFDALSFLFSAVSVLMIRKPEPPPQCTVEPHLGREILEGLQTSWNHPVLRAFLGRRVTSALMLGFFTSLYFLFAIRDLGLTAVLVGIVVSVGGASSLVGALAADRLARRFGIGPTLIGSSIVIGVAALLVPLAHGSVGTSVAFLIAAQLGDLAWPVFTINETTLRQALAPDRLMGRVNSSMHMAFRGGLPLGALAGGVLADGIGVRSTLAIGAAGLLLSNLWLVLSPVRRLRELPQPCDY